MSAKTTATPVTAALRPSQKPKPHQRNTPDLDGRGSGPKVVLTPRTNFKEKMKHSEDEDAGFVDAVAAGLKRHSFGRVDDATSESQESADVSPGKKKKLSDVGHPVSHPHHRRGKKGSGSRKRKKRKPDAAPFNTTQFIMNDHGDTIQYLDRQLGVKSAETAAHSSSDPASPAGGPSFKGRIITRARESSFSLDSDEDFFYSSPEDEGDFLSKEFLKDYNQVRADRLVTMSKGDLINEYMNMESRIETLEKKLERAKAREEAKNQNADFDLERGEVPMAPEMAEKIRIFQREIHLLESENRDLRRENASLARQQKRPSLAVAALFGPMIENEPEEEEEQTAVSSSSSSDDSDSSSSSSSDDSSSDSSDDDEEEEEPAPTSHSEVVAAAPAVLVPEPVMVPHDEQAQDTGYESGQSAGGANVVTSTSS